MKTGFTVLALAMGVLVGGVGHATEARPAFVEQLQRELGTGNHTTRVVVGSFIEYYDQSYRRTVRRRVDTEVYPSGEVRYLCTKGVFNTDWSPILSLGRLFDKTFYVAPAKMKSLPQGSSVRLIGIDVKNDHLEIALDTQGRVPHVKLKLMLGKDLRRQTLDSAMEALSAVIAVQSFERARQIQQEYAAVVRRLDESRSLDAAPQDDAIQRLRAAEGHRQALLDAERICQDLEALGRVQPDAARYADERAKVEETIVALKVAARTARLSEINRSLQAMAGEIDSQLSQVGAAGAARGREQAVTRCGELLAQRDALLEERASLGQPPTDRERARLTQDRQTLSKATEQMAAQKQAAESTQRLVQLDSAYLRLEKNLATAREAYAKAFGTPDQAGAARRLLSQLQQVYENRAAAGRAGSAEAAGEAAELQKEIERMKRVVR